MQSTVTLPAQRTRTGIHPVVAVGAGLVALQLLFRAWALFPAWFSADDFMLIGQARGSSLGLDYLLRPFTGHFTPTGRAIAWLVASSGTLHWPMAAAGLLLLQLLAGAACLWMLITLFGPRWGILAPLTVYLTSVMTVPATLWWTAGVEQLPLQSLLCLTVGAWVMYLRTGRRVLGIAVVLIVAFALLTYVKALLIAPVLLYLYLAYFARGSFNARLRQAALRFRVQAAVCAVVIAAYLAYYVSHVPSLVRQPPSWSLAGGLADTMVGQTLATGALGGPWRWASPPPPGSLAFPPTALISASWVALVLLFAYFSLTRVRTGRGWALLGWYVCFAYVQVLLTRAPVIGSVIGREYRYLTDVHVIVVLTLGAISMPIVGALDPCLRRKTPLLTVVPKAWWAPAAVTFVSVSGLLNSTYYAHHWQSTNRAKPFLETAGRQLHTAGLTELADQTVPENVVPKVDFPFNTTARLIPLLGSGVRATFPETSDALMALDSAGHLSPADIQISTKSRTGSAPECGWRVESPGLSIPLVSRTYDYVYWLKIDYIASRDSAVRVTVDDIDYIAAIRPGVNALYVHVHGAFDSVGFSGLTTGAVMCVTTIKVGQATPSTSVE